MPSEPFRDRSAIVTGGGSGIGRALSRELARRGAVVIVADVDAQAAEAVAAGITQSGGRASPAELDVRHRQAVIDLVGRVAKRHGRLDYMFNNAGIAVTGDARDLSLEHWQRTVDVNLWGVIHGTFAAYDLMTRQQSGHIVNIASVAGLVPFPTTLPYATTKHAVVGLSTSLRIEAEDLGVKVTVVCPGFIDTNIYQAAEMVNVPRDEMNAGLFFKKMDAQRAAATILRGVARNRAILTFPRHARLLWWSYRLRPGLLKPLAFRGIRMLRKLREET